MEGHSLSVVPLAKACAEAGHHIEGEHVGLVELAQTCALVGNHIEGHPWEKIMVKLAID